jgi:ABC-type uncharacterized transport system involved in gliding motility auxiliary subunit
MPFRRRDEITVGPGYGLTRKTRRGVGSIVYAVVGFAALGFLLGLSLRFEKQFDMSLAQSNTLAPQTLAALQSLTEDARIYALFTSKEPRRENYWYLLELFRKASPRIQVEFVDPVAKPGVMRELGVNPQEEGRKRDGLTVVIRGDRRMVFRGVAEEDVTNAILEVGSQRKRVAGFIRGFGERDPASSADEGFQKAAEALRQEYYDLRDIHLEEEISAELTVLVAAGPSMPIPPPAIDRIRTWLDGGGRMLVLLDPGSRSGLEEVLETWGLRASENTVLDPKDNINGRQEFIRISKYTAHPIARGFGKNFPLAIPIAQAVAHFEPADHEVFHDDVALSGDYSLTRSADGHPSQGPFAVAVASWKRQARRGVDAETRVVLVGNSAFASNLYLPAFANKNFFLNAIGWLSREQGLVSIRRQPLAGQTLDFRGSDTRIAAGIILTAPLLVLVIGVVVYLRRRGL